VGRRTGVDDTGLIGKQLGRIGHGLTGQDRTSFVEQDRRGYHWMGYCWTAWGREVVMRTAESWQTIKEGCGGEKGTGTGAGAEAEAQEGRGV
jgi:hypothetical protein